MNITINDLFDAGVHLGHQKRRWNPKSKSFVYDHRSGISIIDLEKTHRMLGEACTFAQELASKGGKILFVATKKQAQEIVREVALSLEMPFCVNRWLGGCLTNFETVKRSLDKYRKFLAMESDGTLASMLKKEAAVIRRQMNRMHRGFEGMLAVEKLPDALFVVDVNYEDIAVAEAKRLGIPVIAMVDTNSDPTGINYVIPANDDSAKSIQVILSAIAESIQSGRSMFDSKQAELKKQRKIVVKEESGSHSVKIDENLAREAEKLTDADEEKALGSSDKPTTRHRRQVKPEAVDSVGNQVEKSEEVK